MTSPDLRAVAVSCTLKRSPAASSTERLLDLLATALGQHGVATTTLRAVDLDLAPGVSSDEGDGDEWPLVRREILGAQILLLGTPIWLGNPSSVCRRVLERLDALLGETDAEDRMIATDRVAVLAAVGNEDGAHNVIAQLAQGLNDIGFSIPTAGSAYWVGEAMGSVDFKDLDEIPGPVRETLETAARNAAHLARVLAAAPYPGP